MARLPYPNPDTLPADVREALQALPVQLNVFRMLAHAPTAFRPWLRLGMAILNELQLEARLRELAILIVARQTGCAYEWAQHVALARAVGVADEYIHSVETGNAPAPSWTAHEQIVVQVARQLCHQARLDDDLWQRLTAHFSPREVVELCLVVGFYSMLARVLETTGVDLDAPFATALVRPAPSA